MKRQKSKIFFTDEKNVNFIKENISKMSFLHIKRNMPMVIII